MDGDRTWEGGPTVFFRFQEPIFYPELQISIIDDFIAFIPQQAGNFDIIYYYLAV